MSTKPPTSLSSQKSPHTPEKDNSSATPDENAVSLDYSGSSELSKSGQVPRLNSVNQVLAAQRVLGNRVVRRLLASQPKRTSSSSKSALKKHSPASSSLSGTVQLFRDED